MRYIPPLAEETKREKRETQLANECMEAMFGLRSAKAGDLPLCTEITKKEDMDEQGVVLQCVMCQEGDYLVFRGSVRGRLIFYRIFTIKSELFKFYLALIDRDGSGVLVRDEDVHITPTVPEWVKKVK